MAGPLLRIAFLHLAPVPGAVAQNRHLVTQAITTAACAGADCIITPELAVSGYTFADTLGTDWIAPQPDHWMSRICRLAARLRVTLFLAQPEKDPRSQQLYNTVFAIGSDGRIAGRHRKINALRVGSEAWSTPGTEATAFRMAPFGHVGLLICADAYSPGIAKSLKAQGAKVLAQPEKDPRSQQLYNTVFAIGSDGRIAGRHRKINALRVGSEAWSTPGTEATAFRFAPFGRVGLLICADAFTPGIAKSLKEQGARVLVSSAAWAPGLHGPNGEWERCTKDTGLPLFVCNRTGQDRTLDFRKAESVVAQGGKRLLSLSCEQSAIFLFEWNLTTGTLAGPDYERLLI